MKGTVLDSETRTEPAVSEDVRTGSVRGAHVFLDITGTPIAGAQKAVEDAEAKVAEAAEGAPKEAAEAELKAAEEALEEAEATKIKFHIDAKDPASGNYYNEFAGSLDVDAGTLASEPQTIFVTNLDPAPNVWRVRVDTDEGAEWTYSVGASPIR